MAGQSFSVGLQIQGLITLNDASYIPKPFHSTLLAIGAVSVGCIFNTFFARKLPLVETLMLILHVLGFFAILIPLVRILIAKGVILTMWLLHGISSQPKTIDMF